MTRLFSGSHKKQHGNVLGRDFCLGFAFHRTLDQVLLIEKKRPAWAVGLFNGIGGSVEEGETPEQAMCREGVEEAGIRTAWDFMGMFHHSGNRVYVFRTLCGPGERYDRSSTEDENLLDVPIQDILLGKIPVVSNLKWMIPFCMEIGKTSPGMQAAVFTVFDLQVLPGRTAEDSWPLFGLDRDGQAVMKSG